GFERSRRTAAGSAAGGAGREGRPDGREPSAGAGSRQSAGGQEHAESFGADESAGGGEGAVQEDRHGSRGGGPAAGGGLSGVPRASAAGDGSRSGRHGRSAVWAPGRAVLSRLLRGLLLSAAVYLLWPSAVGCALAAVEYRCLSGVRGGIGTD